ncbi:hypothetical protein N7493_004382 [Penicillium malachiteum]|uniref:Uncharacterized protein n=1 Tax=Penicillium malachiteum TaxID=1324776 RepID=A0AAD6MX92_9EURO|nr:hypothetical protein N7493_004382 [Penicillium malachiteum]
MGAVAPPRNTGGPGAKKSSRTSYSGVLKSGTTKTESISKTKEKIEEKIKTKKKPKTKKKDRKKDKKKSKDEDKNVGMANGNDNAPVIEIPFRPRSPWKSPVIEVTDLTDDLSDVPMPEIDSRESSDDEGYGIGPDVPEEIDASLYFKLIEEDEKIHPE